MVKYLGLVLVAIVCPNMGTLEVLVVTCCSWICTGKPPGNPPKLTIIRSWDLLQSESISEKISGKVGGGGGVCPQTSLASNVCFKKHGLTSY